jgi:flagellar motor switch protein FliN/FliY
MSDPQESSAENQDELAAAWADALEDQGDQSGATTTATVAEVAGEPVARAQFQQLAADSAAQAQPANLDMILDIPVTIAMEIGRSRINIRNLLQLNQGSVVELDRLAGEPMDVLVNGTLIAHGEVVVVNEKFGIRLTDVISPAERVKKLR